MALLDLSKGQLNLIQTLIRTENPGLANADLNAYFNRPYRPVVNQDGTVTMRFTGKSGGATEGGFGIFDFKYNRIDLDKYFIDLPPVVVAYQPSGVDDILFALADQYGLVIAPEMIEPFTVGSEGPIALKFLDNFVIANPTFTIEYREPELTDISAVYRTTTLPGFTAPWPYPTLLTVTFTVTSLPTFVQSAVVWNLDAISEQWVVESELKSWLGSVVPGGGFDPDKLSQSVTEASKGRHGVWQCVNAEGLPNNLWNSIVVYNGVPRTSSAFTDQFNREIEIVPSLAYLPQGRGSIHIYYNVEEE